MVLMIIVTLQVGLYGVFSYGFPDGLQLMIVNFICLSLWLVVAAVMIAYAPTLRARAELIGLLCVALGWGLLLPIGLFTFPTSAAIPFESRRIVLAVLMNVANIIGFMSPLEKLFEALKTGNTDKMPAILVYANIINCSLWCAYGALIPDVWVYGPNGLGVFISLAQAVALSSITWRNKKAAAGAKAAAAAAVAVVADDVNLKEIGNSMSEGLIGSDSICIVGTSTSSEQV